MHHPHPHLYDVPDSEQHRCCASHRAILSHPYSMPNQRSTNGLPPGHPGQGSSPLGPAYDQGGGRAVHGGPGNGMENPGQGRSQPPEEGVQRKRIPVACGRCRKRKIRCSGDNGNGEPCTNCRSAGFSPCQFLRVQSHDPHNGTKDQNFGYNIDSSRQFQVRGSLPPNHYDPGNGFEGLLIAANAMPASPHHLATMPYRNGSAYPYGPQGPDTPRTSGYLTWNHATGSYVDSAAAEALLQVQNGHGGNTGGQTSAHAQQQQHAPQSFYPHLFDAPREGRYVNTYNIGPYTIAGHPSSAVVSLASLATRPSPATPIPVPNGAEHPGSFTYHNMAQAQALHSPTGEHNNEVKTEESSASSSTVASGSSSERVHSTAAHQELPRNDSMSSVASYNRSTGSPNTSIQGTTPSTSYDSYSPSPNAGYGYTTSAYESRSASAYVTSPRATASEEPVMGFPPTTGYQPSTGYPPSTGFPPSSSVYVYHDTTAAAALAAASNRRGTPNAADGRLTANGSSVASGTDVYGPPPLLNAGNPPFVPIAEHGEEDQRNVRVPMKQ